MSPPDPIPAVLLPGYMLDEDLWREFEDGLNAAGHPRLSIHHGDLSQDATIEAMAARVLANAPQSFLLVGFSMGGYVAREIARVAPQRVLAMVLIATSSEGDNDIQRQRKSAVMQSFDPSRFAGLSRSAVLSSVAHSNSRDAIIDRIQAMSERLGGHVFQRQSALVRASDTDRLSQIACPTLIVAGAEDRLRSLGEASTLHAGIPNSNLVVVAGCGHMIPLEAPDELVRIVLAWLRENLKAALAEG